MRERCKHPGCTEPPLPSTGKGRPKEYCKTHQPKKRKPDNVIPLSPPASNDDDDLDAAAEALLEHASARGARKRAGATSIEIALRAWRSQLLAVYMTDETTPAMAAELAGIEVDDATELAELARAASHFQALGAGDPVATSGIINRAIAAGAIRLSATLAAATPSQLMAGLFRLADLNQKIVGKAQTAYTALTLVFETEGKRWSTDDLLPKELRAAGPLQLGSGPTTRPSASATTRSERVSIDPAEDS